MELAALQKVAPELNQRLAHGYINKIHQPLPREIILRIRVPQSSEKTLVLSADPRHGRIHLTRLRIPNPSSPPRFCSFLRAHFQGFRIIGVDLVTDDRVVFIDAVRGQDKEQIQRRLVLELLGRDSNIILVDRSTNKIMDCLHRIPQKETGTRVVWPDAYYCLPPKKISRGSQSPDHSRMRPEDAETVLLQPITAENLSFVDENEQIDRIFSPVIERLLLESLRNQVAKPVKSRLRSLDRRIEKIHADALRLSALASRQEDGEFLKANLKTVKKGMKEIVVQDWNTGEPRTIGLNPALDAVANMHVIFAKAAKGKRGERIVQQRLIDAHEEKMALADLLFYVAEAPTLAELEGLAADFSPPGIAPNPRTPKNRHQDRTSRSDLFREFRTHSGKLVLVGKSGKGNDFILRSKARRGDLWFHCKGYAGAHILLVQGTDPSFKEDEIQLCADLAVSFSKARNRGKTEVMLADAKDVRRIPGSLPGRVSVQQYRTVVGEGAEISGSD